MAQEIVLGRAVLDRDGYRLVPEAFDPVMLAALRALGPLGDETARKSNRARTEAAQDALRAVATMGNARGRAATGRRAESAS